MSERSPSFQELRPLALVIAGLMKGKTESPAVRRVVQNLVKVVGNERYILTEATDAELAQASTPQLARIIVKQRHALTEDFKPCVSSEAARDGEQGALDFGVS